MSPARRGLVGRVSLVIVLLLALAGTAATASSASEPSGRPDRALGRAACLLMDRVHTASGCSRTECRERGERIRYSPNAETCTIGGREGTSYGSEIDSRICSSLHRTFVAAVNFCAANPHRERTLIYDAPQCVKPWTAYVTTSRTHGSRATRSEAEGRYDVCVRPQQAHRLERESARSGRNLRSLAVSQSQSLYAGPGDQDPTVLVVGDSLTWRGTNELGSLRPDWAIDGASGRNLGELGARVRLSTSQRGLPTGLVVALGTNPTIGYSLADLHAVLATLPDTTPVMVVTPFRRASSTNTRDQVQAVARADDLVQELARTRPLTCVADWAGLVSGRPAMLVDGTHQTRAAEKVWARFVSDAWQACPAS